jgi:arsenical pump membrane protein
LPGALVSGTGAELVAVVLLVASLLFAVLRPHGLTEAIVAVPAAALVVLLGVVPGSAALRALREIGPTVGFLAAILAFGHLCAEAGVFAYLGSLAGRLGGGRPPRLLLLVVVLAALVTATLTLDATVVLLTPIVLATTRGLAIPVRPYAYACVRLANSGSLLLPVSNLTNLLAFGRTGLSFGRFTALMVLPWLVTCAAEWLALRRWFRTDLEVKPEGVVERRAAPRYALAVLAGTVALFVVASALDVAPAWAALTGCVALLARRPRRTLGPAVGRAIVAASPGFCAFVLGLAVVVDGVTRHGLGTLLDHLTPGGASLPALLAVAGVAALVANVLNNLPATLALVPVVAGSPGAVLAVLLGVNIGPNATYPGSLATLLWRRQLPAEAEQRAGEFHRFGLLTVAPVLALATVALWLGLRVVGA